MKTITLIFAAALLSMASACSPKPGTTTKIVGQFAENAPETVRFTRGYIDGTTAEEKYISFYEETVKVVNGHFETEIPKYLATETFFRFGDQMISFVSDGSTITIDPEAHTAVSSDENGPHSQYVEFGKRWDDYQAKMFGFGNDQEARDKYINENLGALLDYTMAVARNNRDNINGLNAFGQIYFSTLSRDEKPDPEEMLALLNSFSDEIKTEPMSSMVFSEMFNIYDGLVKTLEGKPFVDFTVVQDPENPETSTVKLSDYVGKGKYILVDFWHPWCGPCIAEMPNLVNVYNTYHGDNFDMLSIAVWDNLENIAEIAKENGIVWNQIFNAQQIPGTAYGFSAIPLTILFGPDGTILKRDLRGEQIGEAVKEALGV